MFPDVDHFLLVNFQGILLEKYEVKKECMRSQGTHNTTVLSQAVYQDKTCSIRQGLRLQPY